MEEKLKELIEKKKDLMEQRSGLIDSMNQMQNQLEGLNRLILKHEGAIEILQELNIAEKSGKSKGI